MEVRLIHKLFIILITTVALILFAYATTRILDLNYTYDECKNKNPIYNAEKTLPDALECLIKQTLKDIEIICINDGSKDKSLNILKNYAKKYDNIRIYSQRNKGAGAARNKGLDLARGKYIIFLDADDLFKRDMLEKTYLQAVKTNSEIVVFDSSEILPHAQHSLRICNYKRIKTDITTKEVFNYKDVPEYIYRFTYFQVWNKLYLRDFLIKNSIRHQEIRYFEDLDFVYSAFAIAKRISMLNEQFVIHKNIRTIKTLSIYGKKNKDYFYDAFAKLQQSITEKSNWDILKQSYTNLLVSVFFVEYRNTKLQYPSLKEQREIIQNNTDNMVEILKQIGISDLKPNYFYSSDNYTKLRAILVLYKIFI